MQLTDSPTLSRQEPFNGSEFSDWLAATNFILTQPAPRLKKQPFWPVIPEFSHLIVGWVPERSPSGSFPQTSAKSSKKNFSMKSFKDVGFNRLDSGIKDFWNIIITLAGSNKPWEVADEQALAKLVRVPIIVGDLPDYSVQSPQPTSKNVDWPIKIVILITLNCELISYCSKQVQFKGVFGAVFVMHAR